MLLDDGVPGGWWALSVGDRLAGLGGLFWWAAGSVSRRRLLVGVGVAGGSMHAGGEALVGAAWDGFIYGENGEIGAALGAGCPLFWKVIGFVVNLRK